MAVTRLAQRGDCASEYVEGCKQSGGAVAKVIMSHAFDVTQPHWQHRLSAFQSLNLALLVHAQHQGVVWWVEVESHDVAHFLHKERIGGELKAGAAVGLQAEQLEVAPDGALGNPGLRGGQAHTPVGGGLRFGVQYAINQFRYRLIAMATWASGPQLIVQTAQPLVPVALAPQADGRRAQRAALGNGLVGDSGSRQQHYLCPPNQRLRHTARTHQCLQLLPILLPQHHRLIRPAHRASSTTEPTRTSTTNQVIYGTG